MKQCTTFTWTCRIPISDMLEHHLKESICNGTVCSFGCHNQWRWHIMEVIAPMNTSSISVRAPTVFQVQHVVSLASCPQWASQVIIRVAWLVHGSRSGRMFSRGIVLGKHHARHVHCAKELQTIGHMTIIATMFNMWQSRTHTHIPLQPSLQRLCSHECYRWSHWGQGIRVATKTCDARTQEYMYIYIYIYIFCFIMYI